MKLISLILASLFSLVYSGCGPSASQIADIQARQQFIRAVAAMKVCATGSTYLEFREKRLALETSYEVNHKVATSQAVFEHLAKVMNATDVLWNYLSIQGNAGLGSQRAFNGSSPDVWGAMLIINPLVQIKADLTWLQCAGDPDFSTKIYVRRGLEIISDQCDILLPK